MTVSHLIVRDVQHAIEIGLRMGWDRIASMRFATPEKHDIRAVSRPGSFLQLPPGSTVYVDEWFASLKEDESKKEKLDAFAREIKERNFKVVKLPRAEKNET